MREEELESRPVWPNNGTVSPWMTPSARMLGCWPVFESIIFLFKIWETVFVFRSCYLLGLLSLHALTDHFPTWLGSLHYCWLSEEVSNSTKFGPYRSMLVFQASDLSRTHLEVQLEPLKTNNALKASYWLEMGMSSYLCPNNKLITRHFREAQALKTLLWWLWKGRERQQN